MDPRDTEYLRTGPMPPETDEVATLLGDFQRSLAAELRERFPNFHYAIMSTVKVVDKTGGPPGTIVAVLPNDAEIARLLRADFLAAVDHLDRDPRERE